MMALSTSRESGKPVAAGSFVGLFLCGSDWTVLRLSDEGESLAEFAEYVRHEAPGMDWIVCPVHTGLWIYPNAMAQYRAFQRAAKEAMQEAGYTS